MQLTNHGPKIYIRDGDNLSSSEFSSLDEFDLALDDNTENADSTRQQEYDSECNWEEPLGSPAETDDTTDQGISGNCPDVITCVIVCDYYQLVSVVFALL